MLLLEGPELLCFRESKFFYCEKTIPFCQTGKNSLSRIESGKVEFLFLDLPVYMLIIFTGNTNNVACFTSYLILFYLEERLQPGSDLSTRSTSKYESRSECTHT